jgi:5-formyltetrahydrofolate cyclo-ligase
MRFSDFILDPLDIILMPGVAFSRKGGRLGHGMGFYDKYLHEYFTKFPDKAKIDKTLLIGLAFQEQMVQDAELPLDPLDYPLDIVLTSD